jgi:two-component system, LytTR family, response regulator
LPVFAVEFPLFLIQINFCPVIKVIVIDDEDCKKETDAFIRQQRNSIKSVLPASEFVLNVMQLSAKTPLTLYSSKKLAINTANKVCVLEPATEIMHCEGSRNYTKFYLTNNRNIVLSKNLMEFEKLLARFNCFIRIHKSHLVNINFLDQFVKTDGGYVLLTDNSRLPVASRKKETLFKELQRL